MKYSEAIRDALAVKLAEDPSVFVLGLGVPDPKVVFGSTAGLAEEFGSKRVFDTPACENATVALMIGAAQQGMRPVMVNQRVDFTLLALDQIVNHAAKWRWMFGDVQKVPIVIRMIVGRGWGQGPQHSQSMHALFAHIPGLKVAAPASPYDAKGLLISAMEGDDPAVIIEHRRLYDLVEDVPSGRYAVPFGQAKTVREGSDVTVVATSQMVVEAQRAAKALGEVGVSAEVIDLRSLRPLDTAAVVDSVRKTARLVVVDADWRHASVSAEVVAAVAEAGVPLAAPPARLTWPEAPAPTAASLEDEYYPSPEDIGRTALRQMGLDVELPAIGDVPAAFHGPF